LIGEALSLDYINTDMVTKLFLHGINCHLLLNFISSIKALQNS